MRRGRVTWSPLTSAGILCVPAIDRLMRGDTLVGVALAVVAVAAFVLFAHLGPRGSAARSAFVDIGVLYLGAVVAVGIVVLFMWLMGGTEPPPQ